MADHNFGSGGPPDIQHVHDFMGKSLLKGTLRCQGEI